jgi:HK97 family phage prohead protease
MKAGALDGLSIGYRTLVDEIDRTTGVRTIKELDLLEGSVVTFPMNEQATVSGGQDRPRVQHPGLARHRGGPS